MKRKTKVVDAGEPSHPTKKLRGDYRVSGEPTIGGKSQSAVQRLLAGAVQHAKVRGGVMPALPFVSSSVSTTPKRESGDHTELLAGANLCTLESHQMFVISSDSSDHSGVNIAEAEVDSIVRTSVPIMTSATTATPTADLAATANERLVGSSVFGGDSSSAGRSRPISGGFSDRTGSDFFIGGIRTIVDPDSNLQRVYEGLSAGITHGARGRTLTDVAAYNPSAEADYLAALQRLQSVNFPLITELKANKDASVEMIMNLLRLEDALAEKLGLVES
nr:nonaspanin [Tanacetum cinerariifolium]